MVILWLVILLIRDPRDQFWLKRIFFLVLLILGSSLETSHAWAQENATQVALLPMFNPSNAKTNTYLDPTYNFSIMPPDGWIPVGQDNKSDSSLVAFANEDPDKPANFAIYYHQGNPIPDSVMSTSDSVILPLAISKLFDGSKYSIYQQNIQRFSDGFVIQAVASQKQATKDTPVIEEFSFWLKDGRQYFLVMVSSQTGFYQNAAAFERSVYTFYVGVPPSDSQIPPWVKNSAKWWADGTIDDKNFLSGIQYLIKNGIIVVPPTNMAGQPQDQIPSWIKNSAQWWASGEISDGDFVKGIQYLISNGIIKV